MRASATWLPGVAASSPDLLHEAGRLLAAAAVAEFVLAKVRISNWLRRKRHGFRALPGSSSHSAATAVTQAGAGTHVRCGLGWLAPDRILLWGALWSSGLPTCGAYHRPMRAISQRVQLGFVALCYAAVVGLSAILVIQRYLLYVRHPDDVAASSGMFAFGDLMLEVFIAGALLIPTILLALVIRKSEPAYTVYSKVLLALSVSGPLSFGLLCIPAVSSGPGLLGFLCLYRLEASPFALVAMGISRMGARFQASKRLTLAALLLESLALLAIVAEVAIALLRHAR